MNSGVPFNNCVRILRLLTTVFPEGARMSTFLHMFHDLQPFYGTSEASAFIHGRRVTDSLDIIPPICRAHLEWPRIPGVLLLLFSILLRVFCFLRARFLDYCPRLNWGGTDNGLFSTNAQNSERLRFFSVDNNVSCFTGVEGAPSNPIFGSPLWVLVD